MDEWTKADTGVGAAIAAGSQAEKGIWALLVIAARVIPTALTIKGLAGSSKAEITKFHLPCESMRAIKTRMATSPIRLVSAVIIPALYDLLL